MEIDMTTSPDCDLNNIHLCCRESSRLLRQLLPCLTTLTTSLQGAQKKKKKGRCLRPALRAVNNLELRMLCSGGVKSKSLFGGGATQLYCVHGRLRYRL